MQFILKLKNLGWAFLCACVYNSSSSSFVLETNTLRGFHVVHNSNGGKWKLVRVCCDLLSIHGDKIFNYLSYCWASLSST
uniref:Secreted protein n=1 Tax=Salix viminalis TaxID=40686 RepID=A0A6N2M3Z7_SALVM